MCISYSSQSGYWLAFAGYHTHPMGVCDNFKKLTGMTKRMHENMVLRSSECMLYHRFTSGSCQVHINNNTCHVLLVTEQLCLYRRGFAALLKGAEMLQVHLTIFSQQDKTLDL